MRRLDIVCCAIKCTFGDGQAVLAHFFICDWLAGGYCGSYCTFNNLAWRDSSRSCEYLSSKSRVSSFTVSAKTLKHENNSYSMDSWHRSGKTLAVGLQALVTVWW